MSGEDIALVLKFALSAWLLTLAAVFAFRLLRGDINTHGMLSSARGGDIDPERLALALITVSAAGFYIAHALDTPLDQLRNPETNNYVMPDIPAELLALLGGSQSAYLTGKIFRGKNGE